MVGALSLLACGSAELPSFDAVGEVVGSGKNDLWWRTQEAGTNPSLPNYFLMHRVDGADQKIPQPEILRTSRGIASAGPGTIWVFAAPEVRSLAALKIEGSGTVISDRTADFETFMPGDNYASMSLRSGNGGVAFTVGTTKGVRLYRFDGEKFVAMTVPPALGSVGPVRVLGLDDIWFGRENNELVHYKDGAWTEVPGSTNPSLPLSFDATGTVAWSVEGIFEYEGPYTEGVPAHTFVNLQRIENHVATKLRLEFPPNEQNGYGLFAAIARPNGKYALLLGRERGISTFESWVVARSGDANAVGKAIPC